MHDHAVEPNMSSLRDFLYHWEKCKGYMCQEVSRKAVSGTFEHASVLIGLLAFHSESSEKALSLEGRQLLYHLTENCPLDRLLVWVESKAGDTTPCHDEDYVLSANSGKSDSRLDLRDIQRRRLGDLFEILLSRCSVEVFSDLVVVRPLLQYLFKLNCQIRPCYESVYGHLLQKFFIRMCRYKPLFGVCKHVSRELFGQPYVAFSMLAPVLHRHDSVGHCARDALLLVLHFSRDDAQLSDYLAFESDICPILATVLGAIYSSLPTKLVARHQFHATDSPGGPVQFSRKTWLRSDSSTVCVVDLPVGGANWHQLTDLEWGQSLDLRYLLHTIDYCNLVVKISHCHVRDQLLKFILSGFLVPVVGSALHQNATDGVVAATAYLELFLHRLTEPELIKLFLGYILTGSYNNYSVMTSLVNRLNANAVVVTDVMYQLGMVTLSLFRTILNFHCEDVMYELVFKHLRPLHHMVLSTETPEQAMIGPPLCTRASSRLSPNQLVIGLLGSARHFLDTVGAATTSPDNRPGAAAAKAEGVWELASEPRGPSSLLAYIEAGRDRIASRRKACLVWASGYELAQQQQGVRRDSVDSEPLSDAELASQEAEAQQQAAKRLNRVLFWGTAEAFSLSPTRSIARSALYHQVPALYQLNYIDRWSDDDESVEEGEQGGKEQQVETPMETGWEPVEEAMLTCQVAGESASPDDGDQPVAGPEACCTCSSNHQQQLETVYRSADAVDSESLEPFLALLDRLEPPWHCPVHFGNLPAPGFTWPPVDASVLSLLDCQLTELASSADAGDRTTAFVLSALAAPAPSLPVTDSVVEPVGSRALPAYCAPAVSSVGPLLSILLGRLSNMHNNCLFTNLLLTDLIADLASYPCPLLCHYLLNCITVQLRSTVPSVHRAIRSVQSQLHARSGSVADWQLLLLRARLYLQCSGRLPSPLGASSSSSCSSSNRTRIVSNFYARPRAPGNVGRLSYTSCPSTSNPTRIRSPPSAGGGRPCTVSGDHVIAGTAPPPPVSKQFIGPLDPVVVGLPSQPSAARASNSLQNVFTKVAKQVSSPLVRHGLARRSRVLNSSDSDGENTGHGQDVNRQSSAAPINQTVLPDVDTLTRNLVFAAIIFDEFCIELAGLCYAHCLDY